MTVTKRGGCAMRPGYGGMLRAKDVEVRDPEGDGKRKITVRRRIDRLEWLHDRRRQTGIDDPLLAAARRLQQDWQDAQMLVMGAVGSGGGTANASRRNVVADGKLDAMAAHASAEACLPPEIRQIVHIVVCECDDEASLTRAAAIVRVHQKAALPLLRAGLHLLAKYYGLE